MAISKPLLKCAGAYGLATLNKILDTFGDDQIVGYDIACSHVAMVTASSIADKAKCHRLVLAVNAFHGQAHNLICQLNNHPTYLPGVSIEDLETCERVFASSNAIARVQFIDLHYRQWDEDKYLELSRFIYNNYKQALAIISEYTPEVNAFKAEFGLVDEDFIKWCQEQILYLNNLKVEPLEDILQVEYIDALQMLAKAECDTN
ncbi:hypothetical protein K439DRAFT_1644435 [Ramaria rubella]|nr:hypothetical protein K439DRAFT_1644435 [Ramaria rubella]